jgi:hypothetical protein
MGSLANAVSKAHTAFKQLAAKIAGRIGLPMGAAQRC